MLNNNVMSKPLKTTQKYFQMHLKYEFVDSTGTIEQGNSARLTIGYIRRMPHHRNQRIDANSTSNQQQVAMTCFGSRLWVEEKIAANSETDFSSRDTLKTKSYVSVFKSRNNLFELTAFLSIHLTNY